MSDTEMNTQESRRILIIDDTKAIHDDFNKILAADQSESSAELDDMEAALFGGGEPETNNQTSSSGGFELVSAFQGQEAAEKVKESLAEGKPFALAFVDMRMPPGWDGVETIQRLWEIDPRLNTVICTAYSDYSWDEILDKLNNEDRMLILKKPFEHIEVLQMANALVSKWNLARQAELKTESLARIVQKRTAKVNEQKQQLEEKVQQLEDTRLQLIQSEKMASIGQLAAGVAHEINNPVGFISSNLGSLSEYVADLKNLIEQQSTCLSHFKNNDPQANQTASAVDDYKQQIDLDFILSDLEQLLKDSIDGTVRVKDIVADLSEFSHVNSPDLVEEDLNKLIEKTINVVWNEIKYKAEIDNQLSVTPKVLCHGGKMAQVFLNLLVNASHAIESKGVITIKSGQDGDNVWYEVTDNGSGISPDNLSKIFDPFFTTKAVGSGTGLGLHVVQSVIESHGGQISVDSELNVGTTFRITLPINGDDIEQHYAAAS